MMPPLKRKASVVVPWFSLILAWGFVESTSVYADKNLAGYSSRASESRMGWVLAEQKGLGEKRTRECSCQLTSLAGKAKLLAPPEAIPYVSSSSTPLCDARPAWAWEEEKLERQACMVECSVAGKTQRGLARWRVTSVHAQRRSYQTTAERDSA